MMTTAQLKIEYAAAKEDYEYVLRVMSLWNLTGWHLSRRARRLIRAREELDIRLAPSGPWYPKLEPVRLTEEEQFATLEE